MLICSTEKCLILFYFIFEIDFVLFYKKQKFRFWKSLKLFYIFWSKTVMSNLKCLIWFKLGCWSRILAITWKYGFRILLKQFNIFQLRNMLSDRSFLQVFFAFSLIFFFFFFFGLICIFWHYYSNSFELKRFLMILRCTELL